MYLFAYSYHVVASSLLIRIKVLFGATFNNFRKSCFVSGGGSSKPCFKSVSLT